MNNKQEKTSLHANRTHNFSIRKFSVGVASISVGASIVFGIHNDAQAAEGTQPAVEATPTIESTTAPIPEAKPTIEEKTAPTPAPEVTIEADNAPGAQPKALVEEDKAPIPPAAPTIEVENAPGAEATPVAPAAQAKPAAAPAPKATERPKSTSGEFNLREEIKKAPKPATETPKDIKDRNPVDFEFKQMGSFNGSFTHGSITKKPAHVVFEGNKMQVELSVQGTGMANYQVFKDGKQLPLEVMSFDPKSEYAVLRVDVPTKTKELVIKAAQYYANARHEDFETKLVFGTELINDKAKYDTQDEYAKKKLLEPYNKAITLEDKIYEVKKLQEKLTDDKEKAKYAKEQKELEAKLAKEIETAKTEFENAPVKTVKEEKTVKHNVKVLHSSKEEPSHMDFEVKHEDMRVSEVDGKKMLVMTILNASMWKDFQVEGKDGYKRVTTIGKDTAKDQRTIMFPYEEGKALYNAIVKVELGKIKYAGSYHVRIKDLGVATEDNVKPDVKKPEAPKPPKVNKPMPKDQMKADVKKQAINFVVNKEGTDKPSVMDGYMKHPAQVYKQNGKTFVEFTVKNPEWWKSFQLFDGNKELMVTTVSENKDQRVVRVEVKPGTKRLTSKVHIVVPEIKYDNRYTTEIVFEREVKADEVKPNVPKKPDAKKPAPKQPDMKTPDTKKPAPKQPDVKTPDTKKPDVKTPGNTGKVGQETPKHPLETEPAGKEKAPQQGMTQGGKVTQMTTPQGRTNGTNAPASKPCLLYTSDAADEHRDV